MLASIVLIALNGARVKGRMAARVTNLRQLQTALELYYNDTGAYPATHGYGWVACSTNGGIAVLSSALVPSYMASFPTDALTNCSAGQDVYAYGSNGTDYKLEPDHLTDQTAAQVIANYSEFDPGRNGPNIAPESDGAIHLEYVSEVSPLNAVEILRRQCAAPR